MSCAAADATDATSRHLAIGPPLRRAVAMALREYVPGNLICANGHIFTARTLCFPPDQPITFEVDREDGAVREKGIGRQAVAGLGQSALVETMPISDCDLPNTNRKSW